MMNGLTETLRHPLNALLKVPKIKKNLEKAAWEIYKVSGKYARPWDAELVLALTFHTSQLALGRDKDSPLFVEFAPLKGIYGNFRLSGNSLPVFEYQVFDKKLMEFIAVRVEISQPDRMDFIAKIRSNTPAKGEPPGGKCRDGEVVECLPAYRAPFMELAHNLHRYFPYVRKTMGPLPGHMPRETVPIYPEFT